MAILGCLIRGMCGPISVGQGGSAMGTTLLAWAVSLLGASADDGMAPWASDHHPTDVSKQHVQEIIDGKGVAYVVVQGGTMDGRNCRSPQGVWQPFEQSWESNRSVRIENVGATIVVNPWLSNGRNDFRSLDRIVARAIEPGMSDREKARALWWQEVQHRFHYEGDNKELLDPSKSSMFTATTRAATTRSAWPASGARRA